MLAVAGYVHAENGRARSVELRNVNLVTRSMVLVGSDPAADCWWIGGHPRCQYQPCRNIDRLGMQVLNDQINGRTLPGGEVHAVRFDANPIRPALFSCCVFDQALQNLFQTPCTLPKVKQVLPRHRCIRAPLWRITVRAWQLPAVVAVKQDIWLDFEHAFRDLQVVRSRNPIRKDDVAVRELAGAQMSGIAHRQITDTIHFETDAGVKVCLPWKIVHLSSIPRHVNRSRSRNVRSITMRVGSRQGML